MKRYAGIGQAAVGTNKTILTLISATTIRPGLFFLEIGCGATPGDQSSRFHLQRFSAVGTEGSGFVPVALDPADPASLADCGVGTFGAEPTYTANAVMLQRSGHQRATLQWTARQGCEIVAPATANSGLGLKSSTATGTAIHDVTMHWFE